MVILSKRRPNSQSNKKLSSRLATSTTKSCLNFALHSLCSSEWKVGRKLRLVSTILQSSKSAHLRQSGAFIARRRRLEVSLKKLKNSGSAIWPVKPSCATANGDTASRCGREKSKSLLVSKPTHRVED